MMLDRQVQLSLTTTLAWLLWATVVICLLGAYLAQAWLLAATGCAASGAAATLHIRSFFCAFAGRVEDAFQAGRDVERAHLRSLR